MNGTKEFAEDVSITSVEERSMLVWSSSVSNYWLHRSENVSLSNENIGENQMPRKSKVSLARFVH